jgi:hypothetical protein
MAQSFPTPSSAQSARDREDPTVPVEGYPSATSVRQNEDLGLAFSADQEGPLEVTVHWVGATDQLVRVANVVAAPRSTPPGGAQTGFGWPATSFTVPPEWPSGLYRVDAGGTAFHFVVRARDPGSSSPILLVYPATTGQAYNDAGGASLYEFISGSRVAPRVSFDRPGGLDYQREVPFARWFDAAGIATEACTSLDLHADPNLLGAYRLVVSMGHDEYWSKEMRDSLEAFVTAGGNAAFFSANTCWWQVRFERDNRVMVCYKDAAADPLSGVDDSRVTVNWADAPVNRPENSLTGVGWRLGAQVGANLAYQCRFPEHWVFDQTGLGEGDTFGAGTVGYETDACEVEEVDGRPRATGRDGTPPSFVVLATADSGPSAPAPGAATMGLFRRGGMVFTAATTDWGLGLAAGDAALDRITRNVVERLAAPPGPAWERVGEAINVGAMAAEGGRLFAATNDGLLWRREATAQNLHWTVAGDSDGFVAMGANGYAKWRQQQPLYAVDGSDRLLRRDPSNGGAWAEVASANGCTAIGVSNDGVVYGADAASDLWRLDPGATQWRADGQTGIAIRCLAGHYRSLVACDQDGILWRRDVNYGGAFQRIGEAVEGLTAMAVTQGAIFAATGDDTLWRRDLPTAGPDQPRTAALVDLAVPSRLIGNDEALGTVSLDAPAPPGGATVALASTRPGRVRVPANVTVPEGSTEADFTLRTGTQYGLTTVSAAYGPARLLRNVTHVIEPTG